jgi:hypothetical protein
MADDGGDGGDGDAETLRLGDESAPQAVDGHRVRQVRPAARRNSPDTGT